MNYIIYDFPDRRETLKPFTFIRTASHIRLGILRIYEKWERELGGSVSFLTDPYLAEKYPLISEEDNLIIRAGLLPNPTLLEEMHSLSPGSSLVAQGVVLALRVPKNTLSYPLNLEGLSTQDYTGPWEELSRISDIFRINGAELRADFERLTRGRQSEVIRDPYTRVYAPQNIFIEPGAELKDCTLNAEKGPIYIGKNAKVSEGSIIQGAFALGESAVVNPGAKMRGDTTIGPFCKVGGEVSNTVFLGFSNKGHDGFLGNSVIGEWCNLGADTNTSNLKNNYGNIKIWDYAHCEMRDTGLMFCGLMMGDHSKCGINTMFNTGTVVGVNANIFGGGFPPKFVPSFAWGGHPDFKVFDLNKAYEVAERMMQRRQQALTETDREILRTVFNEKSLFYHLNEGPDRA